MTVAIRWRSDMRSLLMGLEVALFTVTAVSPQPASRAGVPPGWVSISPDQLKWTKNSDGTGRETARLFGDPTKPEAFGWVVKWPRRLTTKAHSHPTPRYGMVLSGTFYQGHGNKFDATQLEQRSVGTFFVEPTDVGHFAATKDESAMIYFVGIGPDRTDLIER
jgi:quercetin dioxygenase-like cupin family protein